MRANHPRVTLRSAFTLVELLAVISIIAIVVVVALPALKGLQSTALQTAARQVANEMMLSRQYAITARSPVRFCLAVDSSTGDISNRVCLAYAVCVAVYTNDDTLTTSYWKPIQDWKTLPQGVVFSDHNVAGYDPLVVGSLPTPGVSASRTLSSSGGWQYINNAVTMTVTNFSGGTTNWTTSVVEFLPTGAINTGGSSGIGGGIRLMQGVVNNPNTRDLIITDTNNWAYVEYDQYSGRVRMRPRDSYQ